MNIALFGYGKMGKLIEQIALKRNHTIAAVKDVDTPAVDFSDIEIGIDFSTPEAAIGNIISCLENGVPIISGTTGWLEKYDEVTAVCREKNGAFLYASNFSLGVNIFFALNSRLAKLMDPIKDYKVEIEEVHHIHKLDAPSGTAISLAEDIVANSSYTAWQLNAELENVIPVYSKREGEIPGIHTVTYDSHIDKLEIKHTAHNREGFALGAVVAAEWLVGKSGVYTMKDVLNLG